MTQTLKGKWALVTGSSRGIGRQIALGLAGYGCNIILHGQKAMNTDETHRLIEHLDVQVRVTAGDLGTDDGVLNIIECVKKNPGCVDILYNNAAANTIAIPVCDARQDIWQNIFQINLFAMVRLCSAFAPGMKKRGYGRIINMTSGIANQPQFAAYSASKAAVDKYSRDLACAFSGTNVLVNCIDPGWLKTNLGGPDAMYEVETVLPGALVPALLEDNGPTGRFYAAQDFKYLKC